jgi:hypothetical protein
MPRIREYTSSQTSAQTDIPGRRISASEINTALDNAGAGVMDLSKTVQKIAEEQEVSDVHAKVAKARADWTVQLQERAAQATPGDMGFAQRIRDDYAKYSDEIRSTIQTGAGRRAFDTASVDLAAHLGERAGVYQIQAAGTKAKQDYLVSLDANRNTLLADPTQLDAVLRQSEQALNDPNGTYARMPAEARAALSIQTRKELALSAAQGVIRMDPDLGLKKLQNGDWDAYLDADKKFALEKSAEVAIRGKEVEKDRLERQAEKAKKEAQDAEGSKVFAQMVKDPTALSAMGIANNQNLSLPQREHYVAMLEKAIKPDAIKTDPAVMIDLWDKIHLPDGDPNKIVDETKVEALLGRGLTVENVNALRSEIQQRRTQDGMMESDLKKGFLSAIKTDLSGANQFTGFRDPKGDEQFQKFMSQFLPEYDKQRKAGKSPTVLLDPDSPDYVGKLAKRYKRSTKEFMKDMFDANPQFLLQDDKPGGKSSATPTAPSD